jgi:hypothetical protein
VPSARSYFGGRAAPGEGAAQCSDLTPIFIGTHRNAPLSPMEEGARVHHSYGSYAPSAYGSYGPRNANPSTGPGGFGSRLGDIGWHIGRTLPGRGARVKVKFTGLTQNS